MDDQLKLKSAPTWDAADTPQTVLFTVSAAGSNPVLAIRGGSARCECDNGGYDLADLLSSRELPNEPGFYVWEGFIKVINCGGMFDPPEYDVDWDGGCRPATAADFAAFGYPLPTH